MKTKVFTILIAIMALAVLPAWAEAGWTTLNSAEYGFSIDYPDDWDTQISDDALLTITKLEDDIPMVIVLAAEPILEGDETGLVSPDLEETMSSVEAEISALGLGESVIIERGYSELNGFSTYVMDLNIVLMDTAEMRMYNIIIDQGENSVYLSFAAENNAYVNNLETFAKMINTFRLYSAGSDAPLDPDQMEEAY